MKRVDDQALADFQDEASQKDPRLKDRKVFRGRVSAVSGAAPKVSVEVVKTGESVASPHRHLVTSTWDPAIGDQTDIYWRDEQSAIAVPVGAEALARMPARHPYMCRAYWTGTLSLTAGWTAIGYSSVNYDPLGMRIGAGDILIPVSGLYSVIVRAGTSSGSAGIDITTGIYQRPAGGASVQVSQGSRTTQPASLGNASIDVDVLKCAAGDKLNGYIFTNTTGAILESGSLVNFMAVCLLSR